MRTKASLQELEARRLVAGRLLLQGVGVNEVARLVGAAPSSVSRWKKALKKGGLENLKAKRHPGPQPKLNQRQKQRLVKLLLRGPRKAGYPTDLWTCPRVAEVIQKHFGVRYHVDHVWWILRSLGWSCQKPEQRARQRDEEAIQRWRRYRWPRIVKKGATGC